MAEETKIKDEVVWAIVVYILSIIGVAIVYFTDKKKNDFIVYHAKQSLALFVVGAIVSAVGSVIPIIGWFVILPIGYLAMLALCVLGIINAWKEQKKPLPIIGTYAEQIKF